MQRIMVDFPEPDGPQTTTRSPRLTLRLTSLRTWNSPYHLCTWRISIIGSPAVARSVAALMLIDTRSSLSPAAALGEGALEMLSAFRHEKAKTPIGEADEDVGLATEAAPSWIVERSRRRRQQLERAGLRGARPRNACVLPPARSEIGAKEKAEAGAAAVERHGRVVERRDAVVVDEARQRRAAVLAGERDENGTTRARHHGNGRSARSGDDPVVAWPHGELPDARLRQQRVPDRRSGLRIADLDIAGDALPGHHEDDRRLAASQRHDVLRRGCAGEEEECRRRASG